MEILIDTNFILTCVKQKVDFLNLTEEIIDKEIKWAVPLEVKQELEKIVKQSGKKTKDRIAAETSLLVLKYNNFREIKLNNQNVDRGIVNYLRDKPEFILATLDRDLKKQIKNKILTIRDVTSLEIV